MRFLGIERQERFCAILHFPQSVRRTDFPDA